MAELHSKNFEDIRNYYLMGLWSLAALKQSVLFNFITQEEYNEIVGE